MSHGGTGARRRRAARPRGWLVGEAEGGVEVVLTVHVPSMTFRLSEVRSKSLSDVTSIRFRLAREALASKK